MTRHYTLTS